MGRVVLHLPGGESEKPYVVGTYEGNGNGSRLIPLGFEPSAVAVWARDGKQGYHTKEVHQTQEEVCLYGGLALKDSPCAEGSGSSCNNIVSIEPSGFSVYDLWYGNVSILSNESGTVYYYIAFR